MKTAWISLGMFAIAGCTLAAPPDAARQPYSRELLFAAQGGEDIFGVPLDSAVYRVTPPDYADLRIVCADGREIPYALEKASETTLQKIRHPTAGRIVSLTEPASNRIEIVWELEPDAKPVAGFSFESPLRDFERRVTVLPDGAGADAVPLVSDALLYDYSRFMDVRGAEVALPANAVRRFRIVIDEITDQVASPFTEMTRSYKGDSADGRTERFTLERRPFRIDRISAWHEEEVERVAKERTGVYPVDIVPVLTDDRAKKTTIITVRSRQEPLTSLTIETADRNFSRPCEVEGLEVPQAPLRWKSLSKATLTRVRFRAFSESHLQISFPEQRLTEYRITIQNGDNAPLLVTGVHAEGPIYRLVFLGRPAATCNLHYGSADLRPPAYDAGAVLAVVRKGIPVVEVGLGPEVRHAEYGSGGRSWSRLLNSRSFFVAVVAMVVAALAWGLVRAVRKSTSPEPPPGT